MTTSLQDPTRSASTSASQVEGRELPAAPAPRNGDARSERGGQGLLLPGVDEEFAALLWQLRQFRPGSGVALLVGVTAAGPGLGATTVAQGLASQAGGEREGPVLLVDAHFPSSRSGRGRRAPGGLADLLSGTSRFDEVVQRSGGPFDRLLAGVQSSPWQLSSLQQAISQWREEYDVVIVDLPPAPQLRGVLPLAQQLDASALVVGCGRSTRQQVTTAYQRLAEAGVKVAGTVLNRRRECVPRWLKRWL